jgi:hypothetical protein
MTPSQTPPLRIEPNYPANTPSDNNPLAGERHERNENLFPKLFSSDATLLLEACSSTRVALENMPKI